MGLVSAASTILINVEPRTHLLRWRTIRRFARKSCPRSTANTRCGRAGREGARLPSGSCRRPKSGIRDVQVNVDVAGRHVIEKDANSSMVTDWTVALRAPDPASRSRPPGLARRRQTLLRKDLCATGSEKDSGRGFDQPEEGTRKLDRVAGASLTCEPGLPSGVLGLGELAGPTRQNPAAPTCRPTSTTTAPTDPPKPSTDARKRYAATPSALTCAGMAPRPSGATTATYASSTGSRFAIATAIAQFAGRDWQPPPSGPTGGCGTRR
jgi:hypothetical protein